MPHPSIVIVGGGTAGWIAALHFEKTFYNLAKHVEITVIESSKIPTIGVGEGTTSMFWSLLNFLEIDELEFIRETKATFKYGIRHKNWKTKGVSYCGPIDLPHQIPELKKLSENQYWLYLECLSAKQPISAIHLFTYLMEKKRAPFTKIGDSCKLLSNYIHAYHFDQAKVGTFFRKKRNSKHTNYLDGIVIGAEVKSDTGLIDHVILDDGTCIYGDLFIDCTGFKRILISKTLGSKWVDKTESLPVNRAMPFWLDFEENEEIMPYTLAEAMNFGWMWTIPTQERKGCGYVYSDKFIDPDGARAEVEKYLGKQIEPRNDIKISSGFQEHACIGNCLSLGLSQSFFEPLEATSIHSTIMQLYMFTKYSLHKILNGDFGKSPYNDFVYGQCEDIVDFINLHYAGGRKDTAFWEYVTNECSTNYVDYLLQKTSKRIPKPMDFKNELCPIPSLDGALYLPVLDGLGKLNLSSARRELSLRPNQRQVTKQLFKKYLAHFKEVSELGYSHRSFLDELTL